MARLTDQEIDDALDRGETASKNEPRAASARYDPALRRIVIELTNGSTFLFPPALAQGLETASIHDLSAIEILGSGYGLSWPRLDVDFTVPGLLAGRFGTKAYLARQTAGTAQDHNATA